MTNDKRMEQLRPKTLEITKDGLPLCEENVRLRLHFSSRFQSRYKNLPERGRILSGKELKVILSDIVSALESYMDTIVGDGKEIQSRLNNRSRAIDLIYPIIDNIAIAETLKIALEDKTMYTIAEVEEEVKLSKKEKRKISKNE